MTQKSVTAPVVRPVQPSAMSKLEPAPSSSTGAQYDPVQLRDLHAQEAMVFWAMWMFVAALATILVTGIGTYLIWRQIKLTRTAVDDTRRATEAMERQTDLIERAQRPWVAVTVVPNFAGCGKGIMMVEAVARFRNVGQTAAVAVSTSIDLIYSNGSYAEDIAKRVEARRGDDAGRTSAILPNETIECRLDFAERVETMPFIEDKSRKMIFLVLLATVRYRASGGIPAETLATSRAFLLQRREKTRGRSDEGFVLSTFRADDYAYGPSELALQQLAGERTC
jgi:hypothetical protein